MPANWENSAVATGLEKVSFHSNPKERQCQRMLKLPWQETACFLLPSPAATDWKGVGKINQRKGQLPPLIDLLPAWIPCPCCENYLCTLHLKHVYDCPCLPLEEWNSNPYLPGNHGKVAPEFYEWLMGFPIGWSELKPSAMPSF